MHHFCLAISQPHCLFQLGFICILLHLPKSFDFLCIFSLICLQLRIEVREFIQGYTIMWLDDLRLLGYACRLYGFFFLLDDFLSTIRYFLQQRLFFLHLLDCIYDGRWFLSLNCRPALHEIRLREGSLLSFLAGKTGKDLRAFNWLRELFGNGIFDILHKLSGLCMAIHALRCLNLKDLYAKSKLLKRGCTLGQQLLSLGGWLRVASIDQGQVHIISLQYQVALQLNGL